MGRVIVTALIENLNDLAGVQAGTLTSDQVRKVEVIDALVDSGLNGLLMPKRFIAQLGLMPLRTRNAMTAGGVTSM